MDPVEYTIKAQQIILLAQSISFLGAAFIIILVDPSLGIWTYLAFLPFIFIFLSCFTILTFFWWFFSIRKKVLSIFQVNNLIYSGSITGAVFCFLLVLVQTEQLNIITLILTITGYSLYQLFVNTK